MSNLKQLQATRESRTADRQKAMERLYNTYSGRKARERAEALEMDALMAEQQEQQRLDLERQQMEGSKGWMNLAGMGAAAGTAFGGPVGTAIGGLAGAGLGIFAEASQKKGIAGQHGKKMGWGSALGKTVGRAPTMNEVTSLAGNAAMIGGSMRGAGLLGAANGLNQEFGASGISDQSLDMPQLQSGSELGSMSNPAAERYTQTMMNAQNMGWDDVGNVGLTEAPMGYSQRVRRVGRNKF